MMRPSADLGRVYLCRQAVDFRKDMRSLAVLVEQSLGLVPFAEKKEADTRDSKAALLFSSHVSMMERCRECKRSRQADFDAPVAFLAKRSPRGAGYTKGTL